MLLRHWATKKKKFTLNDYLQCNVRVRDIESHNTVGFVGPTSNMDAVAAAKLTADLQLTLISPSADSGLLSDAEKYPFFLRTTPTIQVDIDIMVDVLTNVRTEYVAAIYQEVSVLCSVLNSVLGCVIHCHTMLCELHSALVW